MRSARLELRVEPELVARIDAACGDVPRSRWVERAIEAALKEAAVDRKFAELKGAPSREVQGVVAASGVKPGQAANVPLRMTGFNGHRAGCGCVRCDDVRTGRRKDAGGV